MASRRVVVISAVVMIAASLLGKWMAILIMIPEPVIGGLFIVLCGELTVAVCMCVSQCRVLYWIPCLLLFLNT